MKKIYVLDTNILLTDFNAINHFGNNDIVLGFKVLEEVDKHKKRQDGVGANARSIIRILDELREKGSLQDGVKLGKGKGVLSVALYDKKDCPEQLDLSVADNLIIAVALSQKTLYPEKKVILVSKDINMRVKCDSLGLACDDYQANSVVNHLDEVYTGFTTMLVDDQIIDRFYAGEKLNVEPSTKKLYPNQFVMLVSSSNDKKTCLCKFKNYNYPLMKVTKYKDVWGLTPKNKEQEFALDVLLNKDIDLVTMNGFAGTGKTLIAVAAGLQQVLEGENAPYKKLVISRPVQPMGKDIGFLPGSKEEKMSPWLAPIKDNLEFLLGDKDALNMYIEKGIIEVEALTYIRGRSISNAYIIIDECQNLSSFEVKSIISRLGQNSKIVLTGDNTQVDPSHLDATNNGLVYALEKMKELEFTAHVQLIKGERSRLAEAAANLL